MQLALQLFAAADRFGVERLKSLCAAKIEAEYANDALKRCKTDLATSVDGVSSAGLNAGRDPRTAAPEHKKSGATRVEHKKSGASHAEVEVEEVSPDEARRRGRRGVALAAVARQVDDEPRVDSLALVDGRDAVRRPPGPGLARVRARVHVAIPRGVAVEDARRPQHVRLDRGGARHFDAEAEEHAVVARDARRIDELVEVAEIRAGLP